MRVGARVLPDDRVVDRLAGLAVPDHGRLALVGDADRRDVARLGVGARPARRRSPRACAVQISVASCSTQPAFGVICSCSRWSTWPILPSLSNRMKRELRRALVDRSDVLAMSAAPPGSSIAVRASSTISGRARRRARSARRGSRSRRRRRRCTPPIERPDDRDPEVGVDVAVVARDGDLPSSPAIQAKIRGPKSRAGLIA